MTVKVVVHVNPEVGHFPNANESVCPLKIIITHAIYKIWEEKGSRGEAATGVKRLWVGSTMDVKMIRWIWWKRCDERRTTSCIIINIKSRHCLQCVGTGTNAHQRARRQRRKEREWRGGKGACGLRKSHSQLTLQISKQNERWKDAKMHCKSSAISVNYISVCYIYIADEVGSENRQHALITLRESYMIYGQIPKHFMAKFLTLCSQL